MNRDDHLTDIGPRRQQEILSQNLSNRTRTIPLSFEKLEKLAIESVDEEIAGYMTSGAGRGISQSSNREAFDRWRIIPRVLRGNDDSDLSVELSNQELDTPLLLAPIGGMADIHNEGELAVARTAATLGLPMILSAMSSTPLEEVANALGDSPKWFQMLISKIPQINESLINRVENSGYDAIVVTVDTPKRGWRPSEYESGFSVYERGATGLGNYFTDPAFVNRLDPLTKLASNIPIVMNNLEYLKKIPAVRRLIVNRGKASSDLLHKPSMSWEDVEEIKRVTSLPVYLKGILHPNDAKMAHRRGVDGIIVSNHGGNHIDSAIASLDALPAIVEEVGNEMDVLIDSGIRSGTDILKAVALGADAVLVGRPYLYGLAINGEQGVTSVMKNLLAELDIMLVNCGFSDINEVDSDILVRPPVIA